MTKDNGNYSFRKQLQKQVLFYQYQVAFYKWLVKYKIDVITP